PDRCRIPPECASLLRLCARCELGIGSSCSHCRLSTSVHRVVTFRSAAERSRWEGIQDRTPQLVKRSRSWLATERRSRMGYTTTSTSSARNSSAALAYEVWGASEFTCPV